MADHKGTPVPDISAEDATRFWNCVRIGLPEECWPWTTGARNKGYGVFHLGKQQRWRTVTATRVAFLLGKGVNPGEMHVCHRCDNPPCCNPAHLWLGTNDDNRRDMVVKQRNRRGATHHSVLRPEVVAKGEQIKQSKIRENDVRWIRHLALDRNIPQRWLRDVFAIHQTQISRIVNGKRWKHIP